MSIYKPKPTPVPDNLLPYTVDEFRRISGALALLETDGVNFHSLSEVPGTDVIALTVYADAGVFGPYEGLYRFDSVFGWTYVGDGLKSVQTVTDPTYTAVVTDHIILIDASSNNVVVTLPTAVGISGKVYSCKRIDNSSNTVTIEGDGSETIDESADFPLFPLEYIEPVSDSSNWWIAG